VICDGAVLLATGCPTRLTKTDKTRTLLCINVSIILILPCNRICNSKAQEQRTPAVAQSKAQLCSPTTAGMTGSNPAEGIFVYLLCLLRVL